MQDIYFTREYGIINELIEDGKSQEYTFHNDLGTIHSLFIKRDIPILVDGVRYYDLVSPYGYGGPVIERCPTGRKEELIASFCADFGEFCRKNNIVSEFVRFHPLIGNGVDFMGMYQAECNRQTVGTNLQGYQDPVKAEFTKSCRKRIRRAIRDGISYKVTRNPGDIHVFKEIYYSTMDRNAAGDYYYFSDGYFEKCLEYFGENILLAEAIYEKKTIAAGFYFLWDKTIHIHLSGTLSDFLYLSPAYILRYAVTIWGIENGYHMIHHGGGRSPDPGDSLYQFKKQFGQCTSFDFYIGKKIWNQRIYDRLCQETNQTDGDGYFPAYRRQGR